MTKKQAFKNRFYEATSLIMSTGTSALIGYILQQTGCPNSVTELIQPTVTGPGVTGGHGFSEKNTYSTGLSLIVAGATIVPQLIRSNGEDPSTLYKALAAYALGATVGYLKGKVDNKRYSGLIEVNLTLNNGIVAENIEGFIKGIIKSSGYIRETHSFCQTTQNDEGIHFLDARIIGKPKKLKEELRTSLISYIKKIGYQEGVISDVTRIH